MPLLIGVTFGRVMSRQAHVDELEPILERSSISEDAKSLQADLSVDVTLQDQSNDVHFDDLSHEPTAATMPIPRSRTPLCVPCLWAKKRSRWTRKLTSTRCWRSVSATCARLTKNPGSNSQHSLLSMPKMSSSMLKARSCFKLAWLILGIVAAPIRIRPTLAWSANATRSTFTSCSDGRTSARCAYIPILTRNGIAFMSFAGVIGSRGARPHFWCQVN